MSYANLLPVNTSFTHYWILPDEKTERAGGAMRSAQPGRIAPPKGRGDVAAVEIQSAKGIFEGGNLPLATIYRPASWRRARAARGMAPSSRQTCAACRSAPQR